MTPEQIHTWHFRQQRQTLALEKMAATLEKMTAALERLAPRTAPNYQYPLESFKTFDWSSIGATVERKDQHGPAVEIWGGQQYVRRLRRAQCPLGNRPPISLTQQSGLVAAPGRQRTAQTPTSS